MLGTADREMRLTHRQARIAVCTAVVALACSLLVSTPAGAQPAGARADLTVSALANPPPSVVHGEQFAVRATVRNLGRRAAGSSRTGFYLSRSSKKARNAVRIGRPVTKRVKPRRSVVVRATVRVPASVPPGRYFLIACADDTRKVRESNERNNCRTARTRVTVRTPDVAPPPWDEATVGDLVLNVHAQLSYRRTSHGGYSPDRSVGGEQVHAEVRVVGLALKKESDGLWTGGEKNHEVMSYSVENLPQAPPSEECRNTGWDAPVSLEPFRVERLGLAAGDHGPRGFGPWSPQYLRMVVRPGKLRETGSYMCRGHYGPQPYDHTDLGYEEAMRQATRDGNLDDWQYAPRSGVFASKTIVHENSHPYWGTLLRAHITLELRHVK
jgi:hypothetical protein